VDLLAVFVPATSMGANPPAFSCELVVRIIPITSSSVIRPH
jgi:hypothetical protein